MRRYQLTLIRKINTGVKITKGMRERMRMRRPALRREQRGQHAPALWSVWIAAPLILVLGSMAAVGVFRWLDARAVPVVVPGGRPRVDTLDVIKTTLTVLAFVGALLAGLYAYRKQRLAEGDATRADAQQFADRYTKALDQLGSEQAAIRLGGVYAMARLADDWKAQRQTCIDVLCAYLRMPYQPVGTPEHRPGEDEVRKTLVRGIAVHLREGSTNISWSSKDLDFTGAYLENAPFDEAKFSGTVRFDGVTFSDAARFERATFSGVTWFSGATFLSDARFGWATFASHAAFNHAQFSDEAKFYDATFRGHAAFDQATFREGANFGGATFTGAAGFARVTFQGRTSFRGVRFMGPAGFDESTFLGGASFERCVVVPGRTDLLAGARFNGPVILGPFAPSAVVIPRDDLT